MLRNGFRDGSKGWVAASMKLVACERSSDSVRHYSYKFIRLVWNYKMRIEMYLLEKGELIAFRVVKLIIIQRKLELTLGIHCRVWRNWHRRHLIKPNHHSINFYNQAKNSAPPTQSNNSTTNNPSILTNKEWLLKIYKRNIRTIRIWQEVWHRMIRRPNQLQCFW